MRDQTQEKSEEAVSTSQVAYCNYNCKVHVLEYFYLMLLLRHYISVQTLLYYWIIITDDTSIHHFNVEAL